MSSFSSGAPPSGPVRQGHTPMSSTSSTQPPNGTGANGNNRNNEPTTVHAFLRATNGDYARALDKAVEDRNNFAAQNAQLWKLVEKQRSGYSGLMKELDRIRGEREAWKAKAKGAARHNSHDDAQPTTDRHPQQRKSSLPPLSMPPRNLTSDSHSVPTGAQPAAAAGMGYNSAIGQTLSGFSSSSHSSQASTSTITPTTATSLSATSNGPPSGSLSVVLPSPANSPMTDREPDRDTDGGFLDLNDSSDASSASATPDLPDSDDGGLVKDNDFPRPPDSASTVQPTPAAGGGGLSAMQAQMIAAQQQQENLLVQQRNEALQQQHEREQQIAAQRAAQQQAQQAAQREAEREQWQAEQRAKEELRVKEELEAQKRAVLSAQAELRQLEAEQQRLKYTQPAANTPPLSLQPQRAPPVQQPPQPVQQQQQQEIVAPATFRQLPLLQADLPHTRITVTQSFVKANDRGKEVLSFTILVDPTGVMPAPHLPRKPGWQVQKMFSDVLGLDQRIRTSLDRSARGGKGSKIMKNLPEGKMWNLKDASPARVDQRKQVLQSYLQHLVDLPLKSNDEVIAFFTSDIQRNETGGVTRDGHKEGYLTKRGKNFGGWKTRYFVCDGPVLEYYESRGGAHLGSIQVTGAQIGRQQRSAEAATGGDDDEKEYRHAFLIVEAKKGQGGAHPRHVLCAESDVERDAWVDILVRYFTGTYNGEDGVASFGSMPSSSPAPSSGPSYAASQSSVPYGGSSQSSLAYSTPNSSNPYINGAHSHGPSTPSSSTPYIPSPSPPVSASPAPSNGRSSTSTSGSGTSHTPVSRPVVQKGPAVPISSLQGGEQMNPKLVDYAAQFQQQQQQQQLSGSLPNEPSPLSQVPLSALAGPERSNSEMGYYPDHPSAPAGRGTSPEKLRARPPQTGQHPSPTDRPTTPELQMGKKNLISGPMNAAPIPAGWNKSDGVGSASSSPAPKGDREKEEVDKKEARRDKTKSRGFWGGITGRMGGADKANSVPMPPLASAVGNGGGGQTQLAHHNFGRPVFGVPLEESLDAAQIASLPAVVFRCIQYLEAKKAHLEEGIYRLSGSNTEIKNLKDRFNTEGDLDLLSADSFWDPHAIAGLLKGFFRELPASILTRDLHMRFLSVIDFVDPQERIRELTLLVAALPIANYSLLRALTAHLLQIVKHASINKMTMRNVGIVFSPTLGIPAGVFSLMLQEFDRVFNVQGAATEEAAPEAPPPAEEQPPAPHSATPAHDNDGGQPFLRARRPSQDSVNQRNSRHYNDAAADQLLGISGRGGQLAPPTEESDSESEESTSLDSASEGGDDADDEPGTPTLSIEQPSPIGEQNMGSPPVTPRPKPPAGLSVATSDRGNRHSRMMGLPMSPRPGQGFNFKPPQSPVAEGD